MKAIIATASLFLIAGVCVAGPQPIQRKSIIADILTYTNVTNQKPKCYPGPKVYALTQENAQMGAPVTTQPASGSNSNNNTNQTFTPTPLVNYYKEFK